MTITGTVEAGGLIKGGFVKIACDEGPIHTHYYSMVDCVRRPYGGMIKAWEVPGLAPMVFYVDVMKDLRNTAAAVGERFDSID